MKQKEKGNAPSSALARQVAVDGAADAVWNGAPKDAMGIYLIVCWADRSSTLAVRGSETFREQWSDRYAIRDAVDYAIDDMLIAENAKVGHGHEK